MEDKHSTKRRDFIKKSALGAGLLGVMSPLSLSACNAKPEGKENNSAAGVSEEVDLKMTGYDYPRIKALFDNKIKIEGYSYLMEKSGGISDLNTNVFSGPQTYDVTEIGIVPYINAYANEDFRDYALIPVFPLRVFRHKSIFINADSGISKPEDLKGKKIATPGYSSSSLTWIRGMLQDEYGVSPRDVEWILAQKDSSADVGGKASAQESVIPEDINVSKGTAGLDESELLVSGEVDAVFHAVQPKTFIAGHPKVKRLFEDSRTVEQGYFADTGIFPIMHAVAVRRSLLDSTPGVSAALLKAYSEAKMANYMFMTKLGWAFDSLPWYGQEFEATQQVMGKDFWPYGIGPNKKTLETICRYCFEQGLINKQVSITDLFHSSSLDLVEKNT